MRIVGVLGLIWFLKEHVIKQSFAVNRNRTVILSYEYLVSFCQISVGCLVLFNWAYVCSRLYSNVIRTNRNSHVINSVNRNFINITRTILFINVNYFIFKVLAF